MVFGHSPFAAWIFTLFLPPSFLVFALRALAQKAVYQKELEDAAQDGSTNFSWDAPDGPEFSLGDTMVFAIVSRLPRATFTRANPRIDLFNNLSLLGTLVGASLVRPKTGTISQSQARFLRPTFRERWPQRHGNPGCRWLAVCNPDSEPLQSLEQGQEEGSGCH